MTLRVIPDGPGKSTGLLYLGDTLHFRCALGSCGITREKREGDHATPVGHFPLRQLFYRPDRMAKPKTAIKTTALHPDMGWCDAPEDIAYNTSVQLPYSAHAEQLWRDDALYDVIVVLGYNDDPVIPGRGSAIFMHVAGENFQPTEGCIALQKEALIHVLGYCRTGDILSVGM